LDIDQRRFEFGNQGFPPLVTVTVFSGGTAALIKVIVRLSISLRLFSWSMGEAIYL